ncbi:MAG: anthranilate synthase component I family protein [Phycisphaeraceae bacterium]|nr:anthranilate synthase component I family protein [Phycisphaeraceae bacterium]
MFPTTPNETPGCAEVLRRWPAGRPVAIRWNAQPDSGGSVVFGEPITTRTARTAPELEALLAEVGTAGFNEPSAGAGWFGWISYDAGQLLEPAARAAHLGAIADRLWPLAAFQRIENSFELKTGHGINQCLDAELVDALAGSAPNEEPRYHIEPLDAAANRKDYIAGVERIIEYIRAGDAYQVNLAHRLSSRFNGSSRCIFADLAERASPWHGGYFEADGYALASLSPELFLEADFRSGAVRTRPMKGTRAFVPGTDAAACAELDASAKDRAELAMIVDLMRNDLGRVCELGSVRVEQERRIEKHASGVMQSTATVAGTMRRGTTLNELLRATFPPGSVTGAPKIRAMQIIDELEPVKRGPYCGTMLWLGDDGKLEANVMIRTACLSHAAAGSTLDYSTGAGIVSDSNADGEWAETLMKAQVLRQVIPRAAFRAGDGAAGELEPFTNVSV